METVVARWSPQSSDVVGMRCLFLADSVAKVAKQAL
jgi:hypothetical protein